MIYPYQGCNLACSYCEYLQENEKKPHRVMDFSAIQPSLDFLVEKGLESIEFCGGGEPLLHPKLLDFSRYLKGQGLSLGMLTNGLEFDPDQAPDWVELFSYIRFSMDAATPETFSMVKGAQPGQFEKVCKNINKLVCAVASTEAPCQVSIKACLTKENVGQIGQMIELARELGVSSIMFKTARNSHLELFDTQAAAAQKTIRDLILQSDTGSPQIFDGVRRSRIDRPCILTPLNITIDSDGEIFLCHYFKHRKAKHRIGNMTEPIEKVWGSPRHRQAIEQIKPDECNLYDCRFHTYNRIARKVMADGTLRFL